MLLQGDSHGAVPVHGGFVGLGPPCNIRHASRGTSASGTQLLVPQQRHIALADGSVEQTLPPPYLQALVGADCQELHATGSAEERTI